MKYILSEKEFDRLKRGTYEHATQIDAVGRELQRIKNERDALIIALWQSLKNNPENEPGFTDFTVEVDGRSTAQIEAQVGHRFSHTSPTRIYLFEKSLLPTEETSS